MKQLIKTTAFLLFFGCLFANFKGGIYGASSQLPLPRFVSLKASKVNLHVGPGKRYPVDWVYLRKGLPIEIIAEFDTWRKVEDLAGTKGWIHVSLLSGKRTIVILEAVRALFESPNKNARIVAHLHPGVVGVVQRCKEKWCSIKVDKQSGWIQRQHIWGVYDHEKKF